MYSATFEGTRILLLHQVDDFAVACPNEDLAKRLYDQIGKALQLPSEDTPPFKYLGLIKDFNGLDVAQYSDAIKLSCEKYIDRVLTMDTLNHLLLFRRSLLHHCLSMRLLHSMLIRALLRTLRSMLHS